MNQENIGVYKAISEVQDALAKIGIGKTHDAKAGGGSYKFRGIDDVYNALAPLLPEHGLCILPRTIERSVTERQSKSGNSIFSVVVDMEFDFVCSSDGSKHTVRMMGEAMDSGDKATNKAMSAAYKYACFQAFCIPVEGENDSENKTYEIAYDGLIDTEHAVEIDTLIKESGANKELFLKKYSIADVRDLTASQFQEAKKLLELKKKGKS